MKFIKKHLTLLIAVVGLLVLICFALLLIPESQLPTVLQSSGLVAIISAFLGVIMTVAVTAILLEKQSETQKDLMQRQSEVETQKDKDVIVFEKKLLIYKDFLTKLHEIVKEEKISDDNVKELIFQISYVAMHTEANRVNEILKLLENTVAEIGNNENGYEKLAKNILDIMLVLQESLYLEKLGKTDEINSDVFNGLITNIETTANQPLNIKVVGILKNSNFPNAKKYEDKEKIIRFEVEGREITFELVITSTGKGYVGIRNRYDYSDKNPIYIEMLKNIGFYEWNAGFGMKHFKNYGTKNENELANKIKEDIETFIKNLK